MSLAPLVLVLIVALVAAIAIIGCGVLMERRERIARLAPRPDAPSPAASDTSRRASVPPTLARAEALGDVVVTQALVRTRDQAGGQQFLRFDVVAPRGTRSQLLADHSEQWRAAMADVGARLRADVGAVIFTHGSFVGTDPFSALAAVERVRVGKPLAQALRRRMHTSIARVLGDLGNFGPSYVKLFEEAIGGAVPCHSFIWSSENHHLGRLEAALRLTSLLAKHVRDGRAGSRLLVVGHSHAGQVFALVTRLLARTVLAEAIEDVARARGVDVSGHAADLETLQTAGIDFVTFGAPARYAWAELPAVRSLHVVHGRPSENGFLLAGDDWVRRLGVAGSDFPALAADERRLNAALDRALGPGFAPSEMWRALRGAPLTPTHGELVVVDYGERLAGIVSSGLGHGMYTRFDAMLFHASLVAQRLYPAAS